MFFLSFAVVLITSFYPVLCPEFPQSDCTNNTDEMKPHLNLYDELYNLYSPN